MKQEMKSEQIFSFPTFDLSMHCPLTDCPYDAHRFASIYTPNRIYIYVCTCQIMYVYTPNHVYMPFHFTYIG